MENLHLRLLCQALSRRCVRNCPWRIYRRCGRLGGVGVFGSKFFPLKDIGCKNPWKLAVSQTGKACLPVPPIFRGAELFFVFSGRDPRVDFWWLSFKRKGENNCTSVVYPKSIHQKPGWNFIPYTTHSLEIRGSLAWWLPKVVFVPGSSNRCERRWNHRSASLVLIPMHFQVMGCQAGWCLMIAKGWCQRSWDPAIPNGQKDLRWSTQVTVGRCGKSHFFFVGGFDYLDDQLDLEIEMGK